jgi:aryl sulfotransferase
VHLLQTPSREYRTWAMDSRNWNGYAPRPDDIIIATAPKCGTTWTQQIISALVFQDDEIRPVTAISPWIDMRFGASAREIHDQADRQRHRRFLKTHLPADGLPIFDEVKYVHVARDGRDVFMSMFNHVTGFTAAQLAHFDQIGVDDPMVSRPYPRFPKDPRAYFHEWITTPAISGQSEGTPNPSFFDLEVGYWAERHRPNFLLVHYADLKADLDGEMRRIAEFLGIPVDERVWPRQVRSASFEVMRANGARLAPASERVFDGGAARFFHKGFNGRWRDVLTDEDLALYAAKVRDKFSPGLARWVEGGRRAAGEPRLSAD